MSLIAMLVFRNGRKGGQWRRRVGVVPNTIWRVISLIAMLASRIGRLGGLTRKWDIAVARLIGVAEEALLWLVSIAMLVLTIGKWDGPLRRRRGVAKICNGLAISGIVVGRIPTFGLT